MAKKPPGLFFLLINAKTINNNVRINPSTALTSVNLNNWLTYSTCKLKGSNKSRKYSVIPAKNIGILPRKSTTAKADWLKGFKTVNLNKMYPIKMTKNGINFLISSFFPNA